GICCHNIRAGHNQPAWIAHHSGQGRSWRLAEGDPTEHTTNYGSKQSFHGHPTKCYILHRHHEEKRAPLCRGLCHPVQCYFGTTVMPEWNKHLERRHPESASTSIMFILVNYAAVTADELLFMSSLMQHTMCV